jgi:hypothetical protein
MGKMMTKFSGNLPHLTNAITAGGDEPTEDGI